MREHRLIERLLKVIEGKVVSFRATQQGDPVLVEQVVGFFRNYADHCHHGKEEDILFRELAGRDLTPQLAATMEELLQDHVQGRKLVGDLAKANQRYQEGDRQALGEVADLLARLTVFYPRHIAKEDKEFFYPCMELFSKEEKDAMLQRFWEFDRLLIHELNENMVQGLEARG
jgi:hemerythrin-like domain-containing protein